MWYKSQRFYRKFLFSDQFGKIVDLKPRVLYVPQDKIWWCWILVESLEVTHGENSVVVFFLYYMWGLYLDTENLFVKY